ncbi:mediator of RNA polymerase II transcription subunit 26-like isoform X2 [Palaemon carinicauda]|uniref:mediator of RNA polymerase II transcription subunit 26-like isoform X2 n=1 Tax=Palaemon carinicauda TaxID=392227 RepID=UPI0035B60442
MCSIACLRRVVRNVFVTDMAACLELISKLEKIPITREVLESTRLGKYINDIRRKTSHQELYRRAKDLVRKWRKDVLADGVNGAAGSGPGPGGTGGRGAGNGHPPTSPSSLPSSGNTSPGMSAPTTPSTLAQRTRTASPTLTTAHPSRPLKPVSPALRGRVLSPGLSPAASVAASSGTTPPISTPTRSRSQPHSPAINPSARQASRADASSYAPSIENVSKNNAANKRLRKDEDEISDIPHSKRPKNSVTNGFDDDSRDSFSSVLSNDCTSKVTSVGSEGNRNRRIANAHSVSKKKAAESPVTNTSDPLRQKMAALHAASKASKVKTTSQIVAELAVRKGDSKLAERASKLGEQQIREIPSPGTTLGRTSDHAVVTRNKMDHMQRFLSSQPDPNIDPSDEFPPSEEDGSSISTETEGQDTVSRPITPAHGSGNLLPPVVTLSSNLDLLGITEDESAEEILARLPPIDHNSIVWDDSDDQEEQEGELQTYVPEETTFDEEVEKLVRQSRKVPEEEVKTLHSTNLECQNGNFDMDGKFREWHEVINKKGYQDDPLIVLPYVITDF